MWFRILTTLRVRPHAPPPLLFLREVDVAEEGAVVGVSASAAASCHRHTVVSPSMAPGLRPCASLRCATIFAVKGSWMSAPHPPAQAHFTDVRRGDSASKNLSPNSSSSASVKGGGFEFVDEVLARDNRFVDGPASLEVLEALETGLPLGGVIRDAASGISGDEGGSSSSRVDAMLGRRLLAAITAPCVVPTVEARGRRSTDRRRGLHAAQ